MKPSSAVLLVGFMFLAVTPKSNSLQIPKLRPVDSVQVLTSQDLKSEKDSIIDSFIQQLDSNTDVLKKSIRKKEVMEKRLDEYNQSKTYDPRPNGIDC